MSLKSWISERNYKLDSICLLLLMGILYYYISLFSFSPMDPSSISYTFPEQHVQNWGGYFGAQISAWMISHFGITSYLLPFAFLSLVAILIYQASFSLYLWLCTWLIFWLCSNFIGSISFPILFFEHYPFLGGGSLGNKVSTLLEHYLGRQGEWVFYTGGVLLFCILLLKKPLFLSFSSFIHSTFRRVFSLQLPKFSLFRSQKKPLPTVGTNTPEPLPFREISVHDTFSNASASLPFENRTTLQAYQPPENKIFLKNFRNHQVINSNEIAQAAKTIEKTLQTFGIFAHIGDYQAGPVLTIYELELEEGTKQAKVLQLADDLALNLQVSSVYISPLPEKGAIGIQVPNKQPSLVTLGDVVDSQEYKSTSSPLVYAVGAGVDGKPICADLRAMPHLLLAGATGAGKSVALNSLICSILSKSSPRDVKLLMIDPKMLELSVYEGIPHLLVPPITETQKALNALEWLVLEMEERYKTLQLAEVRNIEGYNEKVLSQNKEPLPYMVVIIDELADLMLSSAKNVESLIQKLAQKSRASGIHLVLATQRPSVDVITGVIKANLPARMAFQVASKYDSRTILDQIGAEKLLGKGDLLFMRPGQQKLQRVQGSFVKDEEIRQLVTELKRKNSSQYNQNAMDYLLRPDLLETLPATEQPSKPPYPILI